MISTNISAATAIRAGIALGVAGIFYLQPYRPMMFVGSSMEPTYRNHSIALTQPAVESDLRHGDVVVIDMPTGPIVKRITFMGGDKILQVMMAQRWVDMINLSPSVRSKMSSLHWRWFTVPAGSVYVLGDNQPISYDSKQFGCIPISFINRKLLNQQPISPDCTTCRVAMGFH